MYRVLFVMLMLFGMLFATEGNYLTGFYVRGFVQSYYQNCTANPPFGDVCDSLMVRPYNSTKAGFTDVTIYPQIYSKDTAVNGKMMYNSSELNNRFRAKVASDGTYKVWVDIAYYDSLEHTSYARLQKITCNNVNTAIAYYGNFDFNHVPNSVIDVRIMGIVIGVGIYNIKIDKYASQIKVNGKYSDIVIPTLTTGKINTYTKLTCADIAMTTPPADVINPLVHNIGNRSQTNNFKPTMLNGRMISKTTYLTKWNRFVSMKKP